MDLSVVIVSYNTKKLTKECIKSVINKTYGIKYEVIVIDNASNDKSAEMLQKLASEHGVIKLILNKKNIGFGSGNNQGMRKSRGRYILLLNSDTLVHDKVLTEMVSWMDKNKKVGISSCALLNKDASLQGTGGYFPTLLRVFSWMTIQDFPLVDRIIKPFHPVHHLSFNKGEGFYKKERELDWLTGAFMFIRREVIGEIGYFDEDYFLYTEETDFCYRAKKAGWKIYYLPQWGITHYGGASGKKWGHVVPEYRGIKTFYRKHMPQWQYPILRALLKIGALGRIIVFGVIKGKEAAKIYVEAFKTA